MADRKHLRDIYRSLLVGAGIETVLCALIYSSVVLLDLHPLPLHPVLILGVLTQLPGVLIYLPFIAFEASLSEQAAGRLELVAMWVVVVGQSLFFATIHYHYARRRIETF